MYVKIGPQSEFEREAEIAIKLGVSFECSWSHNNAAQKCNRVTAAISEKQSRCFIFGQRKPLF